ncbi:MAG: T9SS type A sorting domain-containing protein [Duncaniella sp.]|nr:T9SS type A sorting domain-containing protein [Duncaniella sp.]
MVRAGFTNEEGTVLSWLDDVPVNVPDGKTVTANISGKLLRRTDGQPLATGDYTLRIYDANGIAISEPVNVTISDAPTDGLSYDMSYKVSGALSGDGSSVNPFIVEDQIYLDLTFNVYSGLFDEDITLYAYYDSDYSDASFSGENSTSKIYFLGKGMSQTQVYTVGTANFEPGKTVYIQPYAWSNIMNWLPLRIYVKHVTTGINEIAADNQGIYPNPAVSTTTVTAKADITGIDVYSITGARMMSAGDCGASRAELNVASLPSGHYIVVVNTVNGTETHRLIKK